MTEDASTNTYTLEKTQHCRVESRGSLPSGCCWRSAPIMSNASLRERQRGVFPECDCAWMWAIRQTYIRTEDSNVTLVWVNFEVRFRKIEDTKLHTTTTTHRHTRLPQRRSCFLWGCRHIQTHRKQQHEPHRLVFQRYMSFPGYICVCVCVC